MSARKGKSKRAGAPPTRKTPASSSAQHLPWRLRFSTRILEEDLREIGHDAYKTAKRAIDKKLRSAPEQYGEGLRPPLAGIFKLKSSNVRVAYHIEEDNHEVWVLMIADRKVIWDRHEEEVLSRLGRMREQEGESQGPRPRKKDR